MQIEEGMSYKNRYGNVIGPMAINPDKPTLCGVKGGGLSDYYTATGSSYSDGREHPSDLIEVYIAPTAIERDPLTGRRVRILGGRHRGREGVIEGIGFSAFVVNMDDRLFFQPSEMEILDVETVSQAEVKDAIVAALKPYLGAKIDSDGWIEWSGGECPVIGVEVEYRCGSEGEVHRDDADNLRWEWKHSGGSDDITAYRPLKQVTVKNVSFEAIDKPHDDRFLIVCDLMNALRSAVKDLKTLDKDGRCSDVITGAENAMAIANGRGFRAQSFAERERDLLDSNNFYLDEARLARRQRDAALEEIERYKREVADLHKEADRLAAERNEWQDKAISADCALDAIANRHDEERGMAWLIEKLGAHRRHLEAVIPYAESRVEDMEENVEEIEADLVAADEPEIVKLKTQLRDEAKGYHDKALDAVVEAKRFMGLA